MVSSSIPRLWCPCRPEGERCNNRLFSCDLDSSSCWHRRLRSHLPGRGWQHAGTVCRLCELFLCACKLCHTSSAKFFVSQFARHINYISGLSQFAYLETHFFHVSTLGQTCTCFGNSFWAKLQNRQFESVTLFDLQILAWIWNYNDNTKMYTNIPMEKRFCAGWNYVTYLKLCRILTPSGQ